MKYFNKNRKLTKSGWDAVAGLLFCLPFILGFLVFFLSPIVLYGVMSFSKLTLNDSGNMEFIPMAWENYYEALFVQQGYVSKVFSSMGELLLMFPSILLFSLFMAILLNQKFPGRTICRAIFFLPVLIASGVAAVSQNDALTSAAVSVVSGVASEGGGTVDLTKSLLALIGASIDKNFLDIIQKLIGSINKIAMSSGIQILIFLAGLQNISPSLYEASAIEGATAWENFWKITLPIISPIVLVNAVYTVIDVLGSTSNSVVNELYSLAIVDTKYGLSSAMGIIYFGITFLIVGLVIFGISKMVFYEEN